MSNINSNHPKGYEENHPTPARSHNRHDNGRLQAAKQSESATEQQRK
ncbi:hypothetical protein [Segatella baroniae]|nr:hypothetical protein [Segatella baroniae]